MTEQSCPDDESLISYVEGSVPDPERHQIDAHLGMCDSCVEMVRGVHARLRATQRLELPPTAVMARVRAAPAAELAAVESRRVPVLLRLPILIPMSLAAGALLFVGTHALLAPPQRVLIRAVQMQRATHAAPVRTLPSGQAPIVGRVVGGEMVEVRAEQPDWYRIALPDGSEGWIEAGALR